MTSFSAGARTKFACTVKQHGTRLKQNFLAERWILLTNVVRHDTGQLVAKSIWLREGGWSRNMKTGHHYTFHARTEPCRSNRLEPGISGRINQEWRIVNPNKVSEVDMLPKAKRLDGKEILTFKVQAKQRKKANRESERVNQEQRTDNPNKVGEVKIPQKAKRLDGEEAHASKVRNNPRKKIRRKSRSKTIQSIFNNKRETGPGRVRLWAG